MQAKGGFGATQVRLTAAEGNLLYETKLASAWDRLLHGLVQRVQSKNGRQKRAG